MYSLFHKMQLTSAWEEVVAILMKGHRHDTVGEVKSLLNSIAVVYVNINVKYTGMISVEVKSNMFIK